MSTRVRRNHHTSASEICRIQESVISGVVKQVAYAVFMGSLASIYYYAQAMKSSSLLAKSVILGFHFGIGLLAVNLATIIFKDYIF